MRGAARSCRDANPNRGPCRTPSSPPWSATARAAPCGPRRCARAACTTRPVHRLPSGLHRRQRLMFDGTGISIDMATMSYGRLQNSLLAYSRGTTQATVADRPSPAPAGHTLQGLDPLRRQAAAGVSLALLLGPVTHREAVGSPGPGGQLGGRLLGQQAPDRGDPRLPPQVDRDDAAVGLLTHGQLIGKAEPPVVAGHGRADHRMPGALEVGPGVPVGAGVAAADVAAGHALAQAHPGCPQRGAVLADVPGPGWQLQPDDVLARLCRLGHASLPLARRLDYAREAAAGRQPPLGGAGTAPEAS